LIGTLSFASARIAKCEDRCIDLLSKLIAFILKALGGSEQFGIDCRRPNGSSDLAHRFAHGVQKGAAGILH
jgi:hypothetical protein